MSTTQPSPSSLVADATTVANVVGVDQSPADIGGNGGVLTEPPVTSLAEANAGAVTGAVNALADSQRVAGIRQSDIDVGGNITVRGEMFADTIATSSTTSGDATSNANLGGPDFGGEALDAVGGIVNAGGGNAEGSIIGGGSGSVIGSAGAPLFSGLSAASAATVQDLPARAAELLQRSNGQLQAADAALGLNLTIAAAETTTGEAEANSLMPSQYGINLDTLTIGGAGEVAGGSFAGQAALASTIAGNANAEVRNREVKGVVVDHLSIGSNGALIGEAEALGAALASSVTGESNAFAGGLPADEPIAEQTVIGLDLPSNRETGSPTHVGGNLELQANALLGKFTQASTTTGDASASATGASLDQATGTLVTGLLGGVSGGANGVGGFEATGVLAALAGASTTTGDATALNGNEPLQLNFALLPFQLINVAGMAELRSASHPSMLSLGGDLRDGGLFEGQLFLGSDAATTTGTALASNAGRVYGSSNLDVAIGGGVVSVDGSGQQTNATAAFNAIGSAFTEASTVTAPVADSPAPPALGALAQTLLQGAGFSGSPVTSGHVISVGGNGDLSFASDLEAVTSASAVTAGPADALLVGDPVGVVAESDLRSAGYAPNDGGIEEPINGPERPAAGMANLSIGGSGDVDASSAVQASTSAQNVNGAVDALSFNVSTGALVLDGDSIRIGNAGSVNATSEVLPSSNSAATTTGAAFAEALVISNGMSGGNDEGPGGVIQAGPAGGAIRGLGAANQQNSAASVNGEVLAVTDGETRGIRTLDLSAGLVAQTGSEVVGISSGAYDTAAITTTGDATATGDVSSIGIRKAPMHLSGNVVAISELVNTVAAITVRGNAVATANSLSIGLDQSPVTILAGGTIVASASSVASTTAQTVSV